MFYKEYKIDLSNWTSYSIHYLFTILNDAGFTIQINKYNPPIADISVYDKDFASLSEEAQKLYLNLKEDL